MKTCEINESNGPNEHQLKNLENLLSKIPSDDELITKAETFKALSDPTRIKILHLLQDGELCACEIISALDKPQSTISHHLNVLKTAGFITGRKDGLWIHYQLAEPKMLAQIEKLADKSS